MKVVFRIITVLLLLGVFISCFCSSYAFHCAIIVFCAFSILRCIFSHVKFIEHVIFLGAVAGMALLSIFSVLRECDNGVRIFTAEKETNNFVGFDVIMASPYNAQNFCKVLKDGFVDDSLCKVYENGIYHVGKIDESLANVSDDPELRQKYEASMRNGFLKFYRDYWYLFVSVFVIINIALCSRSNLLGKIALPLSYMALAVLNYTCHSAGYYLLFEFLIILLAYWVGWSFLAKYRVPKDIAKCGGYIVTVHEISTNRSYSYVKYTAPSGKIAHKLITIIKNKVIVSFPYTDDDDYLVVDKNPSSAIIEKFKNGIFIDATDNISLQNIQPSERMKEKYMAKY